MHQTSLMFTINILIFQSHICARYKGSQLQFLVPFIMITWVSLIKIIEFGLKLVKAMFVDICQLTMKSTQAYIDKH